MLIITIALAVLVLKTQENTSATVLKTLVKEGLMGRVTGWWGGRRDCGLYCLKKKMYVWLDKSNKPKNY